MIVDQPLPPYVSQRLAAEALALCRNTLRRHIKAHTFCGPRLPPGHRRGGSVQPKALSEVERQHVIDTLTGETFCNQPPVQVFHQLLEQGEYLCSVSTMHRLLRANELNGERRAQRPPQSHSVPRLRADAPNQVWTWDIAKLSTRKRGEYLSLYVVMDLFSRYIVAWMLSRKENSALSSQLIEEAVQRYQIAPNSLTLHQDCGTPMTAHCYLDLLGELAITASHSRPRVSNDNPMSEAQFKTLKYQLDYPRRFDDYDHAMRWCQDYVSWYNHQHHHSSLAGFTPYQVFSGDYKQIATIRQQALDDAFAKHPQRFSQGRPLVKLTPAEVFINPIPEEADQQTIETGVNFPTLPRVKQKAI
ncbi:IS3 family transposase [Thiomicrospira microaerophila]|uniref:IS3 family transposase n=2 Tax=Thiomicrospira microaerophila TaxID=406020 RepID=UPI00200E32F5|nr:IS3 family transposase [Thiomicrospira microaerophila]UQB43366.1 IS3 family transposase [Thiomicrospira microaerophila]